MPSVKGLKKDNVLKQLTWLNWSGVKHIKNYQRSRNFVWTVYAAAAKRCPVPPRPLPTAELLAVAAPLANWRRNDVQQEAGQASEGKSCFLSIWKGLSPRLPSSVPWRVGGIWKHSGILHRELAQVRGWGTDAVCKGLSLLQGAQAVQVSGNTPTGYKTGSHVARAGQHAQVSVQPWGAASHASSLAAVRICPVPRARSPSGTSSSSTPRSRLKQGSALAKERQEEAGANRRQLARTAALGVPFHPARRKQNREPEVRRLRRSEVLQPLLNFTPLASREGKSLLKLYLRRKKCRLLLTGSKEILDRTLSNTYCDCIGVAWWDLETGNEWIKESRRVPSKM